MKRGRKPIHGKAMTGAERQARHQAKKTAAYLAANPLPEWMAGALTMRELAAGALKLDNVLADIDDPRLRAEHLPKLLKTRRRRRLRATRKNDSPDSQG